MNTIEINLLTIPNCLQNSQLYRNFMEIDWDDALCKSMVEIDEKYAIFPDLNL
jgi:hypothetical protein